MRPRSTSSGDFYLATGGDFYLAIDKGTAVYVTQFGDAPFYQWLGEIGLTPRKSLTLGPIDVPEEFFFHCVRGLLDGDGSVIRYSYEGTGHAAGRRYDALRTQFTSGSRDHLEWLRSRLNALAGVTGSVSFASRSWRLTYAINESVVLLPLIYPSDDVPKLERKWLKWVEYAEARTASMR